MQIRLQTQVDAAPLMPTKLWGSSQQPYGAAPSSPPPLGSGSWESTGTLGPDLRRSQAHSPTEEQAQPPGGLDFFGFEMEGMEELPLVANVGSPHLSGVAGMEGLLPDVPPAGFMLEAMQLQTPPPPPRHWAAAPASAWRSGCSQQAAASPATWIPVTVSQPHPQHSGSWTGSSVASFDGPGRSPRLASSQWGAAHEQQRRQQQQQRATASLPALPSGFTIVTQHAQQQLGQLVPPLPHSVSVPDLERVAAKPKPPAPLRASQRLSRSLPRLRYSDFVEDFDDSDDDLSASPEPSSSGGDGASGSLTTSSAAVASDSTSLHGSPRTLPAAAGFLKSRSGRTVRPQKRHCSPPPPPPPQLSRRDSGVTSGAPGQPRPRVASSAVSKRKRVVQTPAALRDGADPDFGQRRKQHNPWTREETDALVEGVERCRGAGHWQDIKRLGYAPLAGRSAVDLKDKWRNLMRIAELPPAQALARLDKKREAPSAEILERVRAVAAAAAARAADGEARPSSSRARARARSSRF